MICHPVEPSLLPPPPPDFGSDSNTATDDALLFNICDLPPPIPDSPAPAYLTSQLSPGPQRAQAHNAPQSYKQSNSMPKTDSLQPVPAQAKTTQANPTQPNTVANAPPWGQTSKSPAKSNSRGEAPPPTLAKKGKKLNSNFMSQLNSTLGGADKTVSAAPASNNIRPANSAAMNQLKNNRSKDSPPRNHLLSQIHSGVKLKKAANINDRSAPSL